MKKYIFIFSILCALVSSGCSDFLVEESETSFTTSTLFETPEGLEKMVLALYPYERGMVTKGSGNGFLAAYLWGERTTDLCVFTTGDDANLSRYTSPGPGSNIDGLMYNPFWTHRYYIIGRTNEIIFYGNKMGDAAKISVAEASFWRAYCYYTLWTRFSRLYLTTEPIMKDNLSDLTYTPADSADVFKLMYDDLNIAIQDLPSGVSGNEEGRICKATARHLKALVAAWSEDWQEVASQVDAIEQGATHTLVANPANIFNRSDLYNVSEALFTLRFSKERGGGSGHRIGSQFVNTIAETVYTQQMVNGQLVKYNEENLGRSWGLVYANNYLISLYPDSDKRLSAYYKIHYTYQNPNQLVTIPVSETKTENGISYNTTYNFTGSPVKVEIGDTIYGRDIFAATKTKLDRRSVLPSSLKLVDIWSKPLDADNGSASFKDVLIYRLAETYLLGAEAYMHIGNQEKAQYYYNKTWQRAGNPAETRNITFDMIRDEQARELAFEGRRWDFLKRTGIWYSQMIKYAGDFTKVPGSTVGYNVATYGITDGRDKNFGPDPNYYADFNGADNDVLVRYNVKPIHVNWPIPQSQIDAMGPENFPQTAGY
ncbi:MAG: RagB/SusD family nutrient uptake outer membrane protein [Dysgonamonadaceae bacterium]|jgi:hypothetical protein|nr:RagB/SusD family nutrient uptake outer membrane protein [Dysgonamonadaceae bacterium]